MADTNFLNSDKPFFLTYIIDPVTLGRPLPRHDWPLHVSLVPWFVSNHLPQLDEALSELIATIPAFSVKVDREELFGEEKDVRVNLLEPHQQLLSLHLSLLLEVEKAGTIISDEEYLRENFRAHIRHYRERHMNQGDVVNIDGVYIVELTTDTHTTPVKRYEMQV